MSERVILQSVKPPSGLKTKVGSTKFIMVGYEPVVHYDVMKGKVSWQVMNED